MRPAALALLSGWLATVVALSPVSVASGQQPVVTANAPSATASDAETVRERAAAFWAARINGDINAQWQLLEPRGKGRLTPLEYGGTPGAMKYLAYQVEDATINGAFANVKVRVLVQVFLPSARAQPSTPGATVVQDRWVRVKDVWYRALEQEEGREPQPVPR